MQPSCTPYGLRHHPATARPTGRPPSPAVPASVQTPATEKRTRKPDEPTGKMRIEKSVPREVYCPRCGTRMKPSSTPKSFRWFKCKNCGRTHRLWRRFEWVSIREQV
ncbi:MAG: transposase family protein [Planctomycetota bacterium]